MRRDHRDIRIPLLACLPLIVMIGSLIFPPSHDRTGAGRSDQWDIGSLRLHRSTAPPSSYGGIVSLFSFEKVDVNRADAAVLATLPGIGPKLAERIVAYRQAHGPFRNSADMLQVAGIGTGRVAALGPHLRFE